MNEHEHSWRFWGDDPYLICDCGEIRDALNWRVTYGHPFPGWRDFTDKAQAEAFAQTATAEPPATITQIPAATEEQL